MRIVVAVLLVLSSTVFAAPSETDEALLARAQALLERAPLVDGHNDLPSSILSRGWQASETDWTHNPDDLSRVDLLELQPGHPADIPRLREGRVGAQFWAAYVTVEFMDQGNSLRQVLREIDVIHRMVEQYDELELARTADDIERIHGAGRHRIADRHRRGSRDRGLAGCAPNGGPTGRPLHHADALEDDVMGRRRD